MRFVCEECGAVNENPTVEFDPLEDNVVPEVDRYRWHWVCEICTFWNYGKNVTENTKNKIQEKLADR